MTKFRKRNYSFFCIADKPKLASDGGSEKERSGAPLVSTYRRSLAGCSQ